MKKSGDRVLVVGVFLFMLLLSAVILYFKESGDHQRLRERAHYVTDSQVSKLQYVLNTLLLKTQTLEMMVVESGGEVGNFDYIAQMLMDNSAIRSLQLAPGGKVTMVYPRAGNEDAFGDIFGDPDRATEALYARDSGQMTLSGPFDLYQGGLGVVARRPIYLGSERGEKSFWGFSIIVLDLPAAFYPAELDKLVEEGYSYKLHRIHPDTRAVQIIGASSADTLDNPVELSFSVPNAVWTFSVAPTDGWLNLHRIGWESALALAISALIALLVRSYGIMRRQRGEMCNLSMTDSLTGLYNRRMLSKALADFVGAGTPFALFFLDFNGFKQVNDSYGHNCGDLFLKECTRRLSAFCGSGYFLFRNGGDEFSIIVDKSEPDRVYEDIKAAICHLFDEPVAVGGVEIKTSVSIGYAVYPVSARTTDEILHIADQNMYAMKKQFYQVMC